MKLMGIEQLVGTAMSSDSNGIAEAMWLRVHCGRANAKRDKKCQRDRATGRHAAGLARHAAYGKPPAWGASLQSLCRACML